jgi:hypothetical protein
MYKIVKRVLIGAKTDSWVRTYSDVSTAVTRMSIYISAVKQMNSDCIILYKEVRIKIASNYTEYYVYSSKVLIPFENCSMAHG